MASEQRTKRDVVNGLLVHITAETGWVGEMVALADAVFDRLLDDPPAKAEDRWLLRGKGQAYVECLQLIVPQYTHDEIRWQLEWRRERRVANRA